jgi:hypothetical protein
VKTCFNYPQIELIFTRNNLITGICYVSTIFNGLTELSKRKDAGSELLQLYKSFNPANYLSVNEGGKIEHKKDYVILELLLSSPLVLNNMNKNERTELLNTSYIMYEGKAKYWDKFYSEQISPNLLIMAQILNIDEPTIQKNDKIEKDWETLLRTGKTDNQEFVSTLLNDVVKYLK